LHHLSSWEEGQPIAEVNWRAAEKLAACFGGSPWSTTPAAPNFMASAPAPVSGDTVVLHPGASREYQRWPAERYAALAERLVASGHRVEVIGSARDLIDLPQQGFVPKALSSFDDLVQTLRGARLFICNNSGPMHVASALGVPSLVISGPSSPVWDPIWHQDKIQVLREPSISCQPCDRWNLPANLCQRADAPLACLHYWTVDRVEQRVREQLAKTAA
jgi:ADP-heptose:LPS heptosyltransferase